MFKILMPLLFFSVVYLHCDGCDLPVGCEGKAFPYHLCNYDRIITKCTSNPYNEHDNNTLLKPMKNAPCFDYITSSYIYETTKTLETTTSIYDKIIAYHPNGTPIYGYKKAGTTIYHLGTETQIVGQNTGDPIFVPYYEVKTEWVTKLANHKIDDLFLLKNLDGESMPDAENNFNDALEAWTSICENCDLNNIYLQNCCTRIMWTKDDNVFKEARSDPKKTAALASQRMIPPSAAPCMKDCEKSFIYINQTDIYTEQADNAPGNYKKFFITGENEKKDWVSLKAVLMHEMGHIFGFGHLGDESGNPCVENEDYNESIMSNRNFDKHDRGLSADDKCMYMKMYCWEPPVSSVISFSESELEINIAPNPSSEEFNIYLKIGQPQNLNFEIYDNNGNIVTNLGNKFYNVGNHFLNWKGVDKNQKQVVNGNYFLRISNSAKQITKKLIISR